MKLGMFQKEKSWRLIPDFILFTLLTMGLNLLALLATCRFFKLITLKKNIQVVIHKKMWYNKSWRYSMLAVKGYIDGNTVVTIDNSLHDFKGHELLIRIVEKPQVVTNQTTTDVNEKLKALHSIKGVLKDCKPMTIEEIREERLSERYGL